MSAVYVSAAVSRSARICGDLRIVSTTGIALHFGRTGLRGPVTSPYHPMPTIPLTKSELADLAAYIMSLRNPE
jgi:hypothetical protein